MHPCAALKLYAEGISFSFTHLLVFSHVFLSFFLSFTDDITSFIQLSAPSSRVKLLRFHSQFIYMCIIYFSSSFSSRAPSLSLSLFVLILSFCSFSHFFFSNFKLALVRVSVYATLYTLLIFCESLTVLRSECVEAGVLHATSSECL